MKVNPIIAVKNIEESSQWYQNVFGLASKHGGDVFDVLVTKKDEVVICIHKWGEHDHPTIKDPNITPGNGLILYFRTENIEEIRENVRNNEYTIEEEIHLNPNSKKREFSIIDPDGYFLTISEAHNF